MQAIEEGPGRIGALDGLRGVAALAVGFFHGLLHYDVAAVQRVFGVPISDVSGWPDLTLKLLLSIFNGEAAVVIFFVLSGMVLARSLDRMEDVSALRVIFDFCIKRFLRIYPAVIACMAFLYVLVIIASKVGFTAFPNFEFKDVALAASLIDIRIYGPLYTLQIELFAVPFLLFAYLLRRRLGTFVDFMLLFYGLLALQMPMLAFGFSVFGAKLIAFACGSLLAHNGVRDAVKNLGDYAWVFVLLFFLGVPFILTTQMYTVMLAQVFSATLLVAIIAYNTNPLSKILSLKLPLFYGRISYSFYLFNVLALYLAWAVIDTFVDHPSLHSIIWGGLSAVVAVLIATPLSALSERFVEQPGIRLGRAFCAYWLPTRRAAAISSTV